jgi:hypothetical protein
MVPPGSGAASRMGRRDPTMRKACFGSVAALALTSAAIGASAAETSATKPSRIDFETGTIDAPPPGFTAELTGFVPSIAHI